MSEHIDIWSKGEVVRYLSKLVEQKQIMPCLHMGLEHGHASAYYPKCNKEWASRKEANNVPTDITAYNAPSVYWWPVCPPDCPHFSRSDNFQITASRDQYDEGIPSFNENSEESRPLKNTPKVETKPLEHPEKVTINWLITHVDWKFWLACATIIGTTFYLGVQASRISIVKEIFNLPQTQIEQPKEANQALKHDG